MDQAKKGDGMSYVYFIQQDEYIKIGYSTMPYRRLGALGKRCVLLGAVRGGRSRERHLQKLFAASRDHGEWFRRTPDLLQFIARLRFPPRDTKRQTKFFVPSGLHTAIKTCAAREGITIETLTEMAFEAYLKRKERKAA